MPFLHVAAGAICNAHGQVLIAQRRAGGPQGGRWEFPGGKLKPGESAYAALVRELKEELGISVTAARPLIQIRHAYADRKVHLEVFAVTAFRGRPKARENQPLAWVAIAELARYELLEANRPVVTALELPPFYPVLERAGSEKAYRERFKRLVWQGHRLLYWRARDLPEAAYLRLAEEFSRVLAQAGGCLMVRDLPYPEPWGAPVGLHLSARQLAALPARPPGWRWVGAACHSLAELRRASQLGLDFAVLSPVRSTSTHPDAVPLGWQTVRAWIAWVNLPVYLLGGLGRLDLAQAWDCGAQGIAGIGAFCA
nr:7,8-dihydro-8-oxoguanine triphosphatase [uncultured Gammaproteobacteria bacterium]BAL55744.1 7,8-dihydro-8-oxoguanine triphosphatase [uncultured Gammaproteobacteria bacterium]